MSTTNITIRMDTELKKQAEALFSELGMSMTTAFTVFVRQAVYENGIPFRVSRNEPNQTTLDAFREGEQMAADPNARRFKSVDELFEELES